MTFEQVQKICRDASDTFSAKGNAQAKKCLRNTFAKHEVYKTSRMSAREENIDIELEGIWYTISVAYGYKGSEEWTIGRNWQKSPKSEAEKQAEQEHASVQQARLARMFANAQEDEE